MWFTITLKNLRTEDVITIKNATFFEAFPDGTITIKFLEEVPDGYKRRTAAYSSKDYSIRGFSASNQPSLGRKVSPREEYKPNAY